MIGPRGSYAGPFLSRKTVPIHRQIQIIASRTTDARNTHVVATNEVCDPGYESKENSCSSDRSSGRAERQDRSGSNPGTAVPT